MAVFKEVFVAGTLESRLDFQKHRCWLGRTVAFARTAEGLCGPRPRVDLVMPLYTRARLQAYNSCLAEHLARPHIMRILTGLLPPFLAGLMLALAFLWWYC